MSKMFFKCPICGEVREIQYSLDTAYIGCYHDKLENGERIHQDHRFEIQCDKDKIESILDELNIQWGYTEIIWRDWNAGFDNSSKNEYWNGCTAQVFYKNDFVLYDVSYQMAKSKFHIASVNNTLIKKFKTRELAKQACEEDFKKRKANNE